MEADLAAEMGLDAVPEDLWPDLSDPRVDTIVAMAPDAGLFGDVGLAELTVPTMVLGGTGDTGAPWAWGGALARDHMSADTRAMVAFTGADHFMMTTTCDRMPWTGSLPDEYQAYFCEDPAWDKAEALTLVNESTAAWLDHTLPGAEEGRARFEVGGLGDVDGLEVDLRSPTVSREGRAAGADGYRDSLRAN